MTRTIKASGVKPGMEVRWDSGGITYQCKVGGLFPSITSGLVSVEAAGGGYIPLSRTQPVTVLSEPAPPQPEEPTEFGARVVVDGQRFLRAPEEEGDPWPWLEEKVGVWHDWDGLLRLGPVTVVPDQGWTVPTDTPEVPERIEEWDTWEDVPEGVAVTSPDLFCHYRKNQGVVEVSYPKQDPDWAKFGVRYMSRRYGPWTRVTDA